MNFILRKNKSGFVFYGLVLIIFVTAVCFFYYVYGLNHERLKFNDYVRSRKSYYMARAGIEHFKLKFKTMRRRYPETIDLIEKYGENKKNIYNSFREDVIIPSDSAFSGRIYRYGIEKFEFMKDENQNSTYTLKLEANGSFDNFETSLKRYIQFSR